jgi:hypothetical protein
MREGPSRGVHCQIQLWDSIRQKATYKNQVMAFFVSVKHHVVGSSSLLHWAFGCNIILIAHPAIHKHYYYELGDNVSVVAISLLSPRFSTSRTSQHLCNFPRPLQMPVRSLSTIFEGPLLQQGH